MNQQIESSIFPLNLCHGQNSMFLLLSEDFHVTSPVNNLAFPIIISTRFDKTWDNAVVEGPRLRLPSHPLFPLHSRAVTAEEHVPHTSSSPTVQIRSTHLHETL